MKLSVRIAGLCASGTFILTALPGFYQQIKPTDMANMATEAVPGMTILEKLAISLVGAMAAAFIGYIIGDILSNPKGGGKKQKKAQKPQPRQLSVEPVAPSVPSPAAAEPVMYEETPQPVLETTPAEEA